MTLFTQDELDRLSAPFPLSVHTVREGNKVRGGKGIQWFVYMDRSEVEKRLNEVFPGEWGTTQPVITPLGNSVSATIGITIRGITRADSGEDSNGMEKAKGATTDAIRRAAAMWGIAKYLYDIDCKIYTDTYGDKDWESQKKMEAAALAKFTEWYNKKFGAQPVRQTTPPTRQEAPTRDLPPITVSTQAKPPKEALTGNGQHERRIPPQTPAMADVWPYDLAALMAHPDLQDIKPYNHRKAAIEEQYGLGKLNECKNISEAVQVIIHRNDVLDKAG